MGDLEVYDLTVLEIYLEMGQIVSVRWVSVIMSREDILGQNNKFIRILEHSPKSITLSFCFIVSDT